MIIPVRCFTCGKVIASGLFLKTYHYDDRSSLINGTIIWNC